MFVTQKQSSRGGLRGLVLLQNNNRTIGLSRNHNSDPVVVLPAFVPLDL